MKVLKDAQVNFGNGPADQQSPTRFHRRKIARFEFVKCDVCNRFGFGGTIDADEFGIRRDSRKLLECARKDWTATGKNPSQTWQRLTVLERVICQTLKKRGTRGGSGDLMPANLLEDWSGLDRAGFAQVRIGNHRGHSSGQIRQRNNR